MSATDPQIDVQSPGRPPEGKDRAVAVRRIVSDVLARLTRGAMVDEDAIIAQHAELLPELKEELAAAQLIRRAYLAAQRAGSNADPPRDRSASEDAPGGPKPRIQGYLLGEAISSGGQATVYRAVQEATGRAAAVKIIHGGPWVTSNHRLRFDREVEILATLEHPNIVSILDRGRTADGSLYLAMPFVEGRPLDEYAAQRRSSDADWVRRIAELFIQIAEAVHEAHERGVVHRDLKPSNVLVDGRGRAHILDFGLARTMDESFAPVAATISGQIVGTLLWASPEQFAGQRVSVDRRSDVHALGAMLYLALTGTHPFDGGGGVGDLLDGIRHRAPAPPSSLPGALAGLPMAMDNVVLRAMAKQPQDRQPTALALAQELRDCLAGRPIMALASGGRGRRWLVAGLIACVGALLAWGIVRGVLRAGPPQVTVFQLPATTNSIGMRLVLLPAGKFSMGSGAGEEGPNRAQEQHEVTLTRPFYMGVTEVTQSQYQAVMGALPQRQLTFGADLPVQGVRWDDAMEFCRRLGEREGRTYRLPTEAEWEYACRAGSTGLYGGSGDLDAMAWHSGNADRQVRPVGTKQANHWGLGDMHGNVREWCLDAFALYPKGPRADPVLAGNPRERILRGGSVLTASRQCRCAVRDMGSASVGTPDVGFRVVLETGNPNR